MNSITPSGERFPKWIRLRQRAEFQHVYQGGRKSVRRFLVIYVLERPSPQLPTRLGITVSRKAGKAHDRNIARRRLREIFRRLHASLPSGYDFAVNGRARVAKAPYNLLEKEFISCLKDLVVLAPPPLNPNPPSGEEQLPTAP
ncbi:MAG: ribonuclease P protein component [Sumerlaeia bacterium]